MEYPVQFTFDVQVAGPFDTRAAGTSAETAAIDYKYDGLLRYETDNSTFKYWTSADGGSWQNLSSNIAGDSSSGVATQAFVEEKIAEVKGEDLQDAYDTMKELQEALLVDDSAVNLVLKTSKIKSDPGTELSTTNLLAEKYHGVPHSTSDYVKYPIGRIAADTSIATLRSTYTKLDHLISAMLDVGPPPPFEPKPSYQLKFDVLLASNYAVIGSRTKNFTGTHNSSNGQFIETYSMGGQFVLDVLIGSQVPKHTYKLTVDRGSWNPSAYATTTAQTPDSSLRALGYVKGGVSHLVTLKHPGTQTDKNMAFTSTSSTTAPSTQQKTVELQYTITQDWTPMSFYGDHSVGDVTVSLNRGLGPPGESGYGGSQVVFNNYTQGYPTPGYDINATVQPLLHSLTINNPVKYRVKAPVLRSLNANNTTDRNIHQSGNVSNTTGTEYMTEDTSECFVHAHQKAEILRFPKYPYYVHQWIGDPYNEWSNTPISDTQWSISQMQSVQIGTAPDVQYWTWTWTSHERTPPDLKFVFVQ